MKHIIFSLLSLLIVFNLHSQTTVTIIASYDATIGYHDGYPSHANTNYGTITSNAAFTIPGYTTGLNKNRALIFFDFPVIPAGATITLARMNLYAHGAHGSLSGHTGTNNSGYLQRVTQLWDDTTVTWNNQPASTNQNQVLLPPSTSSMQNYTNITVTQLVLDMMSNNNYGFMLRLANEVSTNALLFASVDHTTSSFHPTLEITYTLPGGPCPSYAFEKRVICEGDSAFLQGEHRKTAGYYFDTLINVLNHDSIIVTYLEVSKPENIVQTHTICNGDSIWLAGSYRKNPGVYQQVFTGSGGCDSTILNNLAVVIIDTSITVVGATLTANQQGATYQWIDCEMGFNPIPGAVSQSFTPSMNGSYAAIITKDGCIAISPCIRIGNVTVQEQGDRNRIKLVPNPTNGIFHVILSRNPGNSSIIVQNLSGQEILRQSSRDSKQIFVDLSGLSKGVYVIRILLDDGHVETQKIVLR